MNLHLNDIFQKVKSDFCNLLDFKLRGDTIELITSIPTFTYSYVSVFVSFRDGEYIISDGGWIHDEEYDNEVSDDNIYPIVLSQLTERFSIKETRSPNNTIFYYKKAPTLDLVSAMVLDVGYFISAVVNAQVLEYGEVSERKERKVFNTQMNSYLREKLGKRVETDYSVKVNNEQRIKFNAVVHGEHALNLYIMYVTGSSSSYFTKDISKATINFELLDDVTVSERYIKKVALVNTSAPGYEPSNARVYLDKLEDRLNAPPIYVGLNSKFDFRLITSQLLNN